MTTIEVENIKCYGCANSIEKKLKSFDELKEVSVDIENGRISFHATDQLATEKVIQTLAKMGYPERGKGTNLQKAKSFVSCAIGRFSSN